MWNSTVGTAKEKTKSLSLRMERLCALTFCLRYYNEGLDLGYHQSPVFLESFCRLQNYPTSGVHHSENVVDRAAPALHLVFGIVM